MQKLIFTIQVLWIIVRRILDYVLVANMIVTAIFVIVTLSIEYKSMPNEYVIGRWLAATFLTVVSISMVKDLLSKNK